MDFIKSRKSVRKYKNIKIDNKIIQDILYAGMQAPSAGNEQPWNFIVLRDKKIMKKIMEFHPFSHALITADVAIIVCGDKQKEKFEGFWVLDCSAATENILLAAESNGLGAVWLGIYPIEERVNKLKSLLNLPENIIPLSIVPMGYSDENKIAEVRYDISRIHYDNW